ncbi:glycosyltransferase [Frankia sp. CNm7]|uniref:Glycosyltransferase n=1 Tax=Frankia nepalensis TaxID=1836974 RepID=A0A937US39_9ACTN|nr:glycosyltransferase [Frankia nepalensis]MBL7495989.1 glycosyltransferase [Frankia nepalensis]MBL7513316.1 glycosyltransferase [Frankia nepalensis]MBL7523620.1 glycosyltransferase [Frankia nepalensis]MBL7633464.1 glycosyltransferase [Frankia nepalensis]
MSDAERWIVVVEEPFLPADAGGRVETSGFLTAASNAGIRMQVLVPAKDELDVEAYEAAFPGTAVIRLQRDTSPLAHLRGQPYMYASRPVGPLRRALMTTPPRADAVISYSYRTAHLGEEIARIWRLPHLVRAHNVESEYFKVLARSSSGPRAAAYELEYRKLQIAERSLHHSPLVTAIADISVEDHEWRRERASVTTFHLPPFLPLSALAPAHGAAAGTAPRRRPATLVFVGSLDTPTNIEGLRWFVDHCWPGVQARFPEAVFRVVGRRPEPGLADWLGGVAGVDLHTDVPSVDEYLATAMVSVNPMRSGSGVNIKAIAAMAVATPVVSTRTGSRGLSWEAGTHLLVAEEPAAFVDAVCGLLADPQRAEALGRSGRAYALRNLDHTTLIQRIRAQVAAPSGG